MFTAHRKTTVLLFLFLSIQNVFSMEQSDLESMQKNILITPSMLNTPESKNLREQLTFELVKRRFPDIEFEVNFNLESPFSLVRDSKTPLLKEEKILTITLNAYASLFKNHTLKELALSNEAEKKDAFEKNHELSSAMFWSLDSADVLKNGTLAYWANFPSLSADEVTALVFEKDPDIVSKKTLMPYREKFPYAIQYFKLNRLIERFYGKEEFLPIKRIFGTLEKLGAPMVPEIVQAFKDKE